MRKNRKTGLCVKLLYERLLVYFANKKAKYITVFPIPHN